MGETISVLASSWSDLSHFMLIDEDRFVRFIQEPIIFPMPLQTAYIRGNFLYQGELVPVIDIPGALGREEIPETEEIIITRTYNNRLIALSGLTQYQAVEFKELEENDEFKTAHSAGLLFMEYISFITAEFNIPNLRNRGYWLDVDVLYTEMKKIIEHKGDEAIKLVANNLNRVTLTNELIYETPEFIGRGEERSYTQIKSGNLYLMFEIDNQLYAIGSRHIQSVVRQVPETQHVQLEHFYFRGIIKTIYGTANVYDLRLFLERPVKPNPHAVMLGYRDQNYILLVDTILSYYEPEEVLDNLYPLTGTEKTLYSGMLKAEDNRLAFILHDEKLTEILQKGMDTPLGFDLPYKLQPVVEKEEVMISEAQNIFWVGGSSRYGFYLTDVLHIYTAEQLGSEDDFTEFESEDYGTIPLLNLTKYFKIDAEETLDNVVVLHHEGLVFGVKIPGTVSVDRITQLGNIQDDAYRKFVFADESNFVIDYLMYSDFIGYLLDVGAVKSFIEKGEYKPIALELEAYDENYTEYLKLHNAEGYFFALDELDSLVKDKDLDELYDLEKFLEKGELEKVPFDLSTLNLKIKSSEHVFSCKQDVSVFKIYEDEFKEIYPKGKNGEQVTINEQPAKMMLL